MSIEQNEYDLMYKAKKNETNFSVCSRFQKQKKWHYDFYYLFYNSERLCFGHSGILVEKSKIFRMILFCVCSIL